MGINIDDRIMKERERLLLEGYIFGVNRYGDRLKNGLPYVKELQGYWKLIENKGGGNYGLNNIYLFYTGGDTFKVSEYGDGSMKAEKAHYK